MVIHLIVNGELTEIETDDFAPTEKHVIETLVELISSYNEEVMELNEELDKLDGVISYLGLLAQPKHNQN